jgi:hypothetical protein
MLGQMNKRVNNRKQERYPLPLLSHSPAWWRYDERVGMTKYAKYRNGNGT